VYFSSFIFFYFLCFVGLMDMNSMEEDQHDATQVVRNNGATPSMMGLYDILRNIEQMLAPFKRYIKASEADLAQALPMALALPIVQTTHAKVLACNPKKPEFMMLEEFDGTRSKFHGFV
jgi:hypothetical protein